MSADAGFAVAITIRENLLNHELLLAYAGTGFPQTLSIDVPDGPSGASTVPDVNIDVFLAPPQITCKADHTLLLTLTMWGTLKASVTATEESANVSAQLTVQLQPSFLVNYDATDGSSSLTMTFDDIANDVTATAWDFTVISGPAFSAAADSYLRSDDFRARLQTAVQDAITFKLVKLPTIDSSFLGELATAVNNMTAKSLIVDNALLLGLDVASDNITTNGNVNALTDFAESNDIAAATNAVAIPFVLQKVQDEVSTQVHNSGATLDTLQLTAQTGHFHVAGSASNSEGSASFSFDLMPATFASKPGAYFTYLKKPVEVKPRIWPALIFATANVAVHVGTSWWVDLVTGIGALLNIGIPLIVSQMANSTAAQLYASISNSGSDPIPRIQHLKSATPAGPTVRIAIQEYDITTDGTFIGIGVQVQALPGALIGLTSIPGNLAGEMLSYTVRLPLGMLAIDPALRISWIVSDATGTVLLDQDDVASGRGTLTFVPRDLGPDATALTVRCRVYRVLGAQITDLVNDSVALNIRGALPRGAYVRWHYGVKNPQVGFNSSSDAWLYQGDLVVNRDSNLHRTDQPCANARKRSRYTYQIDTLDALPFPVSEIDNHRSKLCDYCFYGGPGGLRPAL